MALAATLPPARVAKQLRLRLIDLKKQMVTAPAAPPAGLPRPQDFVEVPSVPPGPPPAGALQLELSRADGTRLGIHTPLAPPQLDALVRAFVEGRACGNCPPKAGSFSPHNPWISAKASMD